MRRRVEADLEEELRLHVERDVEQRVASGIAADEARRLTLVAFGGVEQIKEDCRDARGLGLAIGVPDLGGELSIRIALGARSRQVIWVVAREGAALVCVGIGLGLTMSLLGFGAVNRLTVSAPNIQLYRPAVDPVALLSIALLMTTVGILAAYIPARRATAVDPLVALRQQ